MVYAAENSLEILQGTIERITFCNPASGYSVLRLKSKAFRELITITGNIQTPKVGDVLECSGQWVNHPTFGPQFKVQEACAALPSSVEQIQKYLASGTIKGLGEASARKLVAAFGDKVFEAFDNESGKIKKILKISDKKVARILNSWQEAKAHRETFLFLQSLGFGPIRAAKIYKTYGSNTISQVKNNPYQLELDIEGVGFTLADEASQKLGIPKDSLIRAQAGIRHILKENTLEGHCAMKVETLQKKAIKLLGVDEEKVKEGIAAELQENRIKADYIENEEVFYLDRYYQHETGAAKHLKRLLAHPFNAQPNIEPAIRAFEQTKGFKLDNKQIEAIQKALNSKVSIITGGPGTGKTTITQCLLQAIDTTKVALCAPTGRAAKRLNETTGIEAKTIHRLLEYRAGGFFYYDKNPLDVDWVIVDEVSMVDIAIIHHLLKAIPDHARLVLIGDVDQLPSIGPGSVLKDTITAGVIPVTRLSVIQRQAEQSHIVANAHLINAGQMPSLAFHGFHPNCDFYFLEVQEPLEIQKAILNVVCQVIPQQFGLNPKSEVQVLSPMHKSEIGVKALNQALQFYLNPADSKLSMGEYSFREGDKVIQTKNNYDKGVFNGDIGFIQSINKEESLVEVLFLGTDQINIHYKFNELEQLSLAYAITIHKSQGSEYPVIVMPVSTQHYIMLQRNLIYTGITRARKLVILVGQQEALQLAVRNNDTTQRLTNLTHRILT